MAHNRAYNPSRLVSSAWCVPTSVMAPSIMPIMRSQSLTAASRWAMMITVRARAIWSHIGADNALALIVERAGGLVQDQHAWIGGQRPRDRDALALAAREVGAALLDKGVVALRQFLDELVCAGDRRATAITCARGISGRAIAMFSCTVG